MAQIFEISKVCIDFRVSFLKSTFFSSAVTTKCIQFLRLFTQHSDRYLVHHFKFECNDSKVFGNYIGNWTLNKFMSLHDWQQIFISLNAPIQHYIENPTKRPTQQQQHIGDTNIELNIAWIKMDASIYPKLFTEIDFSLVFPYVIKVMVSLRSNIDKFNPIVDVPIESPTHDAVAIAAGAVENGGATETLPNRKRTTKRNVNVKLSPQEPSEQTNGIANGMPIQMKECCVRLPLLQFDENGHVIQERQQQEEQQPQTQPARNNKRKYGSMTHDDKAPSIKRTPIRNGGESSGSGVICADDSNQFLFKCTSSSTPFIRNAIAATHSNGLDDSASAKQKRQRMPPAQRLTISTPVSSQERKTGSNQFNPRIRLLKMPENVRKLSISAKKAKRKNRDTDKKSTKSGKRVIKKKKIRMVPNESQLFETPPPNRKQKKVMADANSAATVRNDDGVDTDAVDVAAAAASIVVTISPPSPVVTTPTTPEKGVNHDGSDAMAVKAENL